LLQHSRGAQRASSPRIRSALTGILAALIAIGALGAVAPVTLAATARVVIVVGPVGSTTADYRSKAVALAAQARSYGASVTELYSPNATWPRVVAAARGANVLIYLGHGNGWPSPYFPWSTATKDGLGLNATANAGNSNVKYYGEAYVAKLGLARNAVVILNHLCFASGDSEWGRPNPTRSVAIQRVDNYGAGFLRSGARAVFAIGLDSVAFLLRGLFRGPAAMTMTQLFWSNPRRTGTYRFGFASRRTPGTTAVMDPYAPSRYYRSVIGWLSTTVGSWRAG
jgi:hypothetical protein